MPATNDYGFTYPTEDDQCDLPVQLRALADSIGPFSAARYANYTDRNTAVTAPAEGTLAFLRDTNYYTVHDGTTWKIEIPFEHGSGFMKGGPSGTIKKLIGGSNVYATSLGGDVTLATSLSGIDGIFVWNGDGAAHGNLNMAIMSISGGNAVVRTWTASSGAALTSANVRFDWLAFGDE